MTDPKEQERLLARKLFDLFDNWFLSSLKQEELLTVKELYIDARLQVDKLTEDVDPRRDSEA